MSPLFVPVIVPGKFLPLKGTILRLAVAGRLLAPAPRRSEFEGGLDAAFDGDAEIEGGAGQRIRRTGVRVEALPA